MIPYTVDNPQPGTCPHRLGGEKRLEQMLLGGFIHPRTGVGHRELYVLPRRHIHVVIGIGLIQFHVGRLDLQAPPVAASPSRAFTTRFITTCCICPGSASTGASSGSRVLVNCMFSGSRRCNIRVRSWTTVLRSSTTGSNTCLATEHQQLPDPAPPPAHTRAADRRQVLFAVLGRYISPQQQIGVPVDHRQQVVEVVRQPARQQSDRLHLLRLPELLLQLYPDP